MKYEYALLLATASLAAGSRHAHQHAHLKHRDTDVVVVNEVKFVYVLDGVQLSEDEVKNGVKNGSLILGDGGKPERVEPVTVTPTPKTTSSVAKPTTSSTSAPVPSPVVMAEAAKSSAPAPSAKVEVASTSSSSSSSYSLSGTGLDTPFENDKLLCSEFPSQYGPIPITWHGYGGWSGVQIPVDKGSCYDDIVQPDHGDEGACKEGAFCSYSCPAGYQKAAWPKNQGCKGQSIGGLQCKKGKLWMPEGSISKTLCIKGDQNVQVFVKNQLSNGGAAFCRTDYPGKEDQSVPVWVSAGSQEPICSNVQETYYRGWNGVAFKPTSAQWYCNKKDIPLKDACTWSSVEKEAGNYSPACLGTSFVEELGQAFISISQNLPSSHAILDYTMELVAEPASGMNGDCAYVYDPSSKSGKYCSVKNKDGSYSGCNSTGCTVAASKGTKIYAIMRDS